MSKCKLQEPTVNITTCEKKSITFQFVIIYFSKNKQQKENNYKVSSGSRTRTQNRGCHYLMQSTY